MKLLRRMDGRTGFEVKIHRIAADGAAVLTERTDALIFGPLRLQFWVCGIFEVHDGRITLWRDYFDFFDMVKATLRGVAGLVIAVAQSDACSRPTARSALGPAQSAEFVERLRPTDQAIGRARPARRGSAVAPAAAHAPPSPFAEETNCAAAVTISLY